MRFLVIVLALVANIAFAADPLPALSLDTPLPAPAKAAGLEFDRAPIVDVIAAYYTEIEKTSYVMASDVYQVEDRVGIVYQSKDKKSMRDMFVSVLRGAGIEVVRKDGIDYLRRGSGPEFDNEIFVYRPKHRDMTYFGDLLSSVFRRGKFTFQRGIPSSQQSQERTPRPDAGTTAYSLQNKSFDVLVFAGPDNEIKRLRKLLDQLDVPEGQVDISAYLYEFSSKDSAQSGLGAVAESLSGSPLVKVNMGTQPGSNYISLSVPGLAGLNLIAQNLSTDGRFKVLSRPYVRVKSGSQARFSSGDEVPVLGNAQVDKNGNPVQSVDYKPSGVILEVLPTVRGDSIALDVDQQLSNFVPTSNGVNNSPTLIKRQIRTSLTTKSGEILVIGGLKTKRENRDNSKLFGFIPFSASSSTEDAEIVVLLEVARVHVQN